MGARVHAQGRTIATVALVTACHPGAPGRGLPMGLEADGVLGVVRDGGGCGGGLEVGIWGERWGTRGVVPAVAEEEESGDLWVWFPIQTALGDGEAALHLREDAAVLPLGARDGEFEVGLRRASPPDEATLAARAASNAVAVAEAQDAWAAGRFLLRSGERVVGDLRLAGTQAQIAVYDATWLTPRPVDTRISLEGADLVVSFPVEPSFQGERGVLRINSALWEAVVPMDQQATGLDRRLQLVPGERGPAERRAAVAEAAREADAIERASVQSLGARLAAEAWQDGACAAIGDLDPSWTVLFAGYNVEIVPEGGACVVVVSPTMSQQGRRFAGRVTSAEEEETLRAGAP